MFRICWLKSKTINFSQSKNWWNSHIICKKTKPACKKNNIPQTVIKVKLNGLHISQRCQPLEAWNLETFSFALPPPPPPPPKSLTHPTINFFCCANKKFIDPVPKPWLHDSDENNLWWEDYYSSAGKHILTSIWEIIVNCLRPCSCTCIKDFPLSFLTNGHSLYMTTSLLEEILKQQPHLYNGYSSSCSCSWAGSTPEEY